MSLKPSQYGRTFLDSDNYVVTDINSGQMYYYNHFGYYSAVYAERLIQEKLKNMLGPDFSLNRIKEVIGWISLETQEDIRDRLSNRYVGFTNGLFDLDNKELIPHTPEILTKLQFDFPFDKNAPTTEQQKMAKDLVGEIQARTLQEMLGNILATDHYKTKKLCYLFGENDSGKSTFMNIQQIVLGKHNYSNLNLSQLEEKFTNAKIFNKAANILSDVPYKLKPMGYGTLKNFTGGDTVTLQFKFKDPFEYESHAKMFFTGNGIPRVDFDAVDDAYYRRWQFIECPNQFNKDITIEERMTTPEKKAGWINWWLEGYYRLRDNMFNLTNEMSVDHVREIFLTHQNQWRDVNKWLATECEVSDTYTTVNDLFKACKKWFEDKKMIMPFVNVSMLGRYMVDEQKQFNIAKVTPKINGRRQTAYKGIKLKETQPNLPASGEDKHSAKANDM